MPSSRQRRAEPPPEDRRTASRVRQMRPISGTALVLAAAAALFAAQAPVASPLVDVSPPDPSLAENEVTARAEASALLASMVLPAGAVRLPAEPAGDDQLLAHNQPLAGPWEADQHGWWLVPGAPLDVLRALGAGLPPGARRTSWGGRLGGPGVPENESEIYAFPRLPDRVDGRELMLKVVQLAGGMTGVEVDATASALVPRSPQQTIPPGVRLLRLHLTDGIKVNAPPPQWMLVRRLAKIEAIRTLLNELPALQPGVRMCPLDLGVRLWLSFDAGSRTPPTATAKINLGGCGGVELTIDGHPEGTVESTPTLLETIERILARKLDTTPRPPR